MEVTSMAQSGDASPAAAPGTGDDSAARRGNGHADVSLDAIRVRAYELYLARGGSHGGDFDDWLAAERELRQTVQPLADRVASDACILDAPSGSDAPVAAKPKRSRSTSGSASASTASAAPKPSATKNAAPRSAAPRSAAPKSVAKKSAAAPAEPPPPPPAASPRRKPRGKESDAGGDATA
jgi:hypothetical protein